MNKYPEWLVEKVCATIIETDAQTFDDMAEAVLDTLGFAPWGGPTYWRSSIQWEHDE